MENTSIGYWEWLIFIGGMVGWAVGIITKGRRFWIIEDIVIGIAGAMLGGWIAIMIGLSIDSWVGAFTLALIIAVILVSVMRFIRRLIAGV